ncbi:L-xylulose reductase-like [Strongylocentrotus purpuratus]|uniref:L-xylulose reductase n=1 Tax=Strongylocentrotus purpuratus TaxID=7668 RepID=A0A7M7SYC4_STRPU|nr:L-xylulose reductase-like [Strongylocentrotus purpuratus]
MEICFKNKRALVTGAGKGIGRGIAVALAKCGASVTALTRSQADLDTLKQEVPGIETICLDVHDWDKTNEVLSPLPPFDLLVNSAGVSSGESCLEVSAEAYDNVMMINHRAILQITKIVAKGMIAKGEGGSIVNLSSIASLQGLTNHAVYASSKGALDSYTKVAALELAKHKIRVNCVNPTVVLTPMARKFWAQGEMRDAMINRIPLGRFLEIEDVVNPVIFLLSDMSAMINGITMPIDGGASAALV